MFSFQGQLSSSECLMYKTKASTASELPTGLVGCFVAALHQFNFCLSMLPSLLYSCCWQHSPDSFLLANLCLTIRFSGNPTYDIFYFSSFYIRKYDYPLCLSISVCLYLSGQSSFDRSGLLFKNTELWSHLWKSLSVHPKWDVTPFSNIFPGDCNVLAASANSWVWDWASVGGSLRQRGP